MNINVCAHGNPMSPKTWSGTSASIGNILLKNNLLGKTINFTFPSLIRKFLYIISKWYYNQSVELHRSPILKFVRSIYVTLQLPVFKQSATLHISNMALPLYLKLHKQHHYVLIDSTWHLWSQNSHFKEKYSLRFLKDVNEMEYKMYQQVKHIFTIGKYVKDDLINHYKIPEQKITAVKTGLGTIQPYYGEKDYSIPELLFVANKRFIDKGGDILVEAFHLVVLKNPEAKLHVVGIEREKLNNSKTNHKNIILHGFINMDKLQEFFNKCTIFVMPAINEPWGLVYLEALSCKCPVIGYNSNAFPEISNNGEFGFILKEYNADSLSKLIIDALSDPERLRSIGIKGQAYVLENYQWENVVDKIVNVIKDE